jgi:hypothetical protein
LHLYYYFLDHDLGLIHVKLQTWFPFRIQVYVNGHEWLARQMGHEGVEYAKLDNAFLRLSDAEKAQKLADGFERVDWVHVLDRYAMRVNPLFGPEEVLCTMRYYWVTAQSEYSTDILFRKRADLEELMPRLCQYSTLYFGATDVMSFLGRKLTGHFLGEVVTDQLAVDLLGKRVPGRRVKHRMKCNWIKMYDKGPVLRVETVINNPEEFRVRRRVRRQGRDVMAWVPLRKSVTMLFRYREISAQSNVRYLDALSQVQDPTSAVRDLDALTRRPRTAGQSGLSTHSRATSGCSSRCCWRASTPCTASPIATCERSSHVPPIRWRPTPRNARHRSRDSSGGFTRMG